MFAFVMILAMLTAGQAQAPNPLASVTTLSCSFPSYATIDWSKNPPEISGHSQDLSFDITAIDLTRRRAKVAGSGGSADVTAVLTPTGLNVIEQTAVGNFILTSVFVGGASNGVFYAVHSRHIGDLKFAPGLSQSYGTCK